MDYRHALNAINYFITETSVHMFVTLPFLTFYHMVGSEPSKHYYHTIPINIICYNTNSKHTLLMSDKDIKLLFILLGLTFEKNSFTDAPLSSVAILFRIPFITPFSWHLPNDKPTAACLLNSTWSHYSESKEKSAIIISLGCLIIMSSSLPNKTDLWMISINYYTAGFLLFFIQNFLEALAQLNSRIHTLLQKWRAEETAYGFIIKRVRCAFEMVLSFANHECL